MIFNQRKMHHINRFVYKPKRHEIVYMQQIFVPISYRLYVRILHIECVDAETIETNTFATSSKILNELKETEAERG